MILCQCRDEHRDHQFTPSSGGLCGMCGHGLGAHKADARRNAEITEHVARLLRVYEIADWRIRMQGDDIQLELLLTPPPPPTGSLR